MQKKLMTALIVGVLLTTTGCKNIFRAYRIDIVQGQAITQEQVDQLRPGMSPAQVRYLLGTPLVTDTLSPSRWDYAYRFLPGTYAKEAKMDKIPHRRVSVFFANGAVEHVEIDGALPTKAPSLPASKDSAVRTTESNAAAQMQQLP